MVQKYDSRLRKIETFYSPKEFRALGYRERWEVRVSDGIWITPEKLVETTMSKREIRANPGVYEEALEWLRGLVVCVPPLARVSESGRSFALTGDAVRDWHRRHGFEVGVKLTDKNLPARFYGSLTEVEGFGSFASGGEFVGACFSWVEGGFCACVVGGGYGVYWS